MVELRVFFVRRLPRRDPGQHIATVAGADTGFDDVDRAFTGAGCVIGHFEHKRIL